ncbi:hypothetical protein [Citrobacter freundii]|uniref:Uncharacterized protein n=1 Tax=Citrobacter freundii TaxID=546 RepID=A0A7G2IU83_CITFR|nr:hypothetical protein [Citrobacter freundii]
MRQKENRWRWLTSVNGYFGFDFAPWFISSGAAGIGCSGL